MTEVPEDEDLAASLGEVSIKLSVHPLSTRGGTHTLSAGRKRSETNGGFQSRCEKREQIGSVSQLLMFNTSRNKKNEVWGKL